MVKLRACIDFRGLIKKTLFDSYLLPRREAYIQALKGSRWFSALDFHYSYLQAPLREEDKKKTAEFWVLYMNLK